MPGQRIVLRPGTLEPSFGLKCVMSFGLNRSFLFFRCVDSMGGAISNLAGGTGFPNKNCHHKYVVIVALWWAIFASQCSTIVTNPIQSCWSPIPVQPKRAMVLSKIQLYTVDGCWHVKFQNACFPCIAHGWVRYISSFCPATVEFDAAHCRVEHHTLGPLGRDSDDQSTAVLMV